MGCCATLTYVRTEGWTANGVMMSDLEDLEFESPHCLRDGNTTCGVDSVTCPALEPLLTGMLRALLLQDQGLTARKAEAVVASTFDPALIATLEDQFPCADESPGSPTHIVLAAQLERVINLCLTSQAVAPRAIETFPRTYLLLAAGMNERALSVEDIDAALEGVLMHASVQGTADTQRCLRAVKLLIPYVRDEEHCDTFPVEDAPDGW